MRKNKKVSIYYVRVISWDMDSARSIYFKKKENAEKYIEENRSDNFRIDDVSYLNISLNELDYMEDMAFFAD